MGNSPFLPWSVVSYARNSAAFLRQAQTDRDAKYLLENKDFSQLGVAIGNLGGWAKNSEKELLEERKRVESLPVYKP